MHHWKQHSNGKEKAPIIIIISVTLWNAVSTINVQFGLHPNCCSATTHQAGCGFGVLADRMLSLFQSKNKIHPPFLTLVALFSDRLSLLPDGSVCGGCLSWNKDKRQRFDEWTVKIPADDHYDIVYSLIFNIFARWPFLPAQVFPLLESWETFGGSRWKILLSPVDIRQIKFAPSATTADD